MIFLRAFANVILFAATGINIWQVLHYRRKFNKQIEEITARRGQAMTELAITIEDAANKVCPFCRGVAENVKPTDEHGNEIDVTEEADGTHVVTAPTGEKAPIPCLAGTMRKLSRELIKEEMERKAA